MRNSLVWMLAALLLVGLAQAVTYSNTSFNATGSNITLTITSTNITADLINVTSTQIALYNVTVNNSVGYVRSSVINLTTGNTTTDSSAFPVLASSSTNVKTIASGLTSNVSAFLNVSTGSVSPSSPLLVHPDGSSEYPSYLYDSVGGTMTFNATIESGTSTLYFTESSASTASICANGTGALGELGGWLPIIVIVITAIIVIGVLSGGFGMGLPTPEINFNNLASITLLIVFTAVTISIASTVLTRIIC